MSVKTVAVDATDYSGPVKAEDLNVGDSLTVEVMGVTTLTSVPAVRPPRRRRGNPPPRVA